VNTCQSFRKTSSPFKLWFNYLFASLIDESTSLVIQVNCSQAARETSGAIIFANINNNFSGLINIRIYEMAHIVVCNSRKRTKERYVNSITKALQNVKSETWLPAMRAAITAHCDALLQT